MDNLGDLNTHLFDQLNRLNKENISEEELKSEIDRSRAMSDVSKRIIETGRLVLDAHRFNDNRMDLDKKATGMLSDGSE